MKTFFTTLALAVLCSAYGQLDKKTWLVSGHGKFRVYRNEYSRPGSNISERTTEISISPSVGYFIANKLATGLRTTITSSQSRSSSGSSGSTGKRYIIGPFARYYFLQGKRPVNITADLSYQYGIISWYLQKNGNTAAFSALTGPVFFFSSSASMELLVGYRYEKEDTWYKFDRSGIHVTMGFQLYLLK